MDEDAGDIGRDGYEEPLMFTSAAVDGAAAGGHLELVRLDYKRDEGDISGFLLHIFFWGGRERWVKYV